MAECPQSRQNGWLQPWTAGLSQKVEWSANVIDFINDRVSKMKGIGIHRLILRDDQLESISRKAGDSRPIHRSCKTNINDRNEKV
jgi:hypothetical protein